jgi:hypothetical protein
MAWQYVRHTGAGGANQGARGQHSCGRKHSPAQPASRKHDRTAAQAQRAPPAPPCPRSSCCSSGSWRRCEGSRRPTSVRARAHAGWGRRLGWCSWGRERCAGSRRPTSAGQTRTVGQGVLVLRELAGHMRRRKVGGVRGGAGMFRQVPVAQCLGSGSQAGRVRCTGRQGVRQGTQQGEQVGHTHTHSRRQEGQEGLSACVAQAGKGACR